MRLIQRNVFLRCSTPLNVFSLIHKTMMKLNTVVIVIVSLCGLMGEALAVRPRLRDRRAAACSPPSQRSSVFRNKNVVSAENVLDEFPAELVDFVPLLDSPVFTGTGTDTWDHSLRERSFILHDGSLWTMWYTGYNKAKGPEKFLGHATSPDGIAWTRSFTQPIHTADWVEDVCVIHHDALYHMFAEGTDDISHRLTSVNGINWISHGPLDIRSVDGAPIESGPYGTPTVFFEHGLWHLYYERKDAAVWLATSRDLQVWTNLQDEPVLRCGPEQYDAYAVAFDQVIRHKGRYYAYYHASDQKEWGRWSTNIATSSDLVHWKKYPRNPVLPANPEQPLQSSGFLVKTPVGYQFYTTHPVVSIFVPRSQHP